MVFATPRQEEGGLLLRQGGDSLDLDHRAIGLMVEALHLDQ